MSLEFEGRDPKRDFTGLGTVVEQSELTVKLRVPRAEVAAVCRRVLDTNAVRDISVQEVPIEEIISQLFAQNKENAGLVTVDARILAYSHVRLASTATQSNAPFMLD